MFTGIIETIATVLSIDYQSDNALIWLTCPLTDTFKIDQSIAHNGICLTVDALNPDTNAYRVTAVAETNQKTTIKHWKPGQIINIERALQLNALLDGHLVQGHVDQTARCMDVVSRNGSTELTFDLESAFCPLIIEKGSIAVDGVSLTVYDVTDATFKVSVIPYTLEHTQLRTIRKNDYVNIEFDLVGKYIHRMQHK
jgi:riboflavin synthase